MATVLKVSSLVVLLAIGEIGFCVNVKEYMKLRDAALLKEDNMMLGADIVLNAKEQQVNKILMEYKTKEFQEGLDSNGAYFAATRHFFHSKPLIDVSMVYNIIKMIPKGAALHMHDVTVGPAEYVALELTKRPDLYYCIGQFGYLNFRFSKGPLKTPCYRTNKWESVEALRKRASSSGYIDLLFMRSMSMYTPTPDVDYPDINRVWHFFENKITTISGVVNYVEAFKDYYYTTLQGFYDDNVMYIEMRGLLIGLYNLDQTILPPLAQLKVFKDVTDNFVAKNPDFLGAKFIYSPHRFQTPADIKTRLQEAVQMKAQYSNFFAGFDLVGQEDIGFPLIYYLTELLEAAAKGVKYYFHAGETAWHGTPIDLNILDALLLNSSRLGHGFALYSHPTLMEEVQKRGIGIETCPISHQVLKLIKDFRNHPAISLMRKGFPFVAASDGPGMWGASPMSHDWYIIFMAMAGKRADLRFLKQLAINSIKYSAMDETEKKVALTKWNLKWEQFLTNIIEGKHLKLTEKIKRWFDKLYQDIISLF